jgi:hypothetical protein
LRWFLRQGLHSFTPWHFIQEPSACESAAQAFQREDVHHREVFVFAHRQDCDDFAGLLIQDGTVTDLVLCFHPVFSTGEARSPRTWNIVDETFEDVFEFTAKRVMPDMKEWALTEDARDL